MVDAAIRRFTGREAVDESSRRVGARHALLRIVQALLAGRDYGSQEICHRLLSLPIVDTNVNFEEVWLNAHHTRRLDLGGKATSAVVEEVWKCKYAHFSGPCGVGSTVLISEL